MGSIAKNSTADRNLLHETPAVNRSDPSFITQCSLNDRTWNFPVSSPSSNPWLLMAPHPLIARLFCVIDDVEAKGTQAAAIPSGGERGNGWAEREERNGARCRSFSKTAVCQFLLLLFAEHICDSGSFG